MESLGRRKRSLPSNQTDTEEDMTLSQEILVLDFGDEKQSESLRQETAYADFGKGELLSRKNTPCSHIIWEVPNQWLGMRKRLDAKVSKVRNIHPDTDPFSLHEKIHFFPLLEFQTSKNKLGANKTFLTCLVSSKI